MKFWSVTVLLLLLTSSVSIAQEFPGSGSEVTTESGQEFPGRIDTGFPPPPSNNSATTDETEHPAVETPPSSEIAQVFPGAEATTERSGSNRTNTTRPPVFPGSKGVVRVPATYKGKPATLTIDRSRRNVRISLRSRARATFRPRLLHYGPPPTSAQLAEKLLKSDVFVTQETFDTTVDALKGRIEGVNQKTNARIDGQQTTLSDHEARLRKLEASLGSGIDWWSGIKTVGSWLLIVAAVVAVVWIVLDLRKRRPRLGP